MVKREALVLAARQDFLDAANKLSLYFRDDQGAPVIVDASRLPPMPAPFPACASTRCSPSRTGPISAS
jgi:hypothetical protein